MVTSVAPGARNSGEVNTGLPRDGLIAEGESWVIGWSAPVLFALFHKQPTVPDFDQFLANQAKDIDDWPAWYQRCVVHHITATGTLTAHQRQAAADVVSARRDKLSAICLGYVFCSPSGAIRGVNRVINWLAPPPYRTFNASTVSDGLRQLMAVDRRIDPTALAGRYQSMFSAYLPALSGKEV